MRDLFDDIFQGEPHDPTAAARRAMKPQLRQRFYGTASVEEQPSGFAVLLDGRPVRTPARAGLAAPTRQLGQALAAEWDAQRDVIDPARMPLTRLANAIIDGVAPAPDRVVEEVASYFGSDLVFYRASAPAGLVARQVQHWDPVMEWARDVLGARFILAEGIAHVAQPAAALAAARAAIPCDVGDVNTLWQLGALSSITSLTGSALIALAVLHGRLSSDAAWEAAHVDEDWNLDQWGHDEQALRQRAFRAAEMQAAATVLKLL
jgi:chaperone required for assembly of F1-ATPase